LNLIFRKERAEFFQATHCPRFSLTRVILAVYFCD
jgi:hypothetical protein